MLIKLFNILLFTLIVSCSHSVHIVNVGDFKPNQKITSGEVIETLAEQFVILGFTMQTNYVNEARAELMKKCDGGTIQGPVTRISTSHGFLSWTNKAHMQALCVKI